MRELPQATRDKLAAGLRARFTELTAMNKEAAEAIERAMAEADQRLRNEGFPAPSFDIDKWEHLARIAEQNPSEMTFEEIYRWALAWIDRERLRAKLRDEATPAPTPGLADQQQSKLAARKKYTDEPEYDEATGYAKWRGYKVYLGRDTQISRLFCLLAHPLGRARTLEEVAQAIDGFETSGEVNSSTEEIKLSRQRVRKAVSKLRERMRERFFDAHLVVVRGGSHNDPEYSLISRH